MIKKQTAIFSKCKNYRYTLWRWWDPEKEYLMVIGLNPSTADATNDDPTIRRCVRFAKDWNFGGLCMTNLFALRATNPKVMLKHSEPIGVDNNGWLQYIGRSAGMILAAWGSHGDYLSRNKIIRKMMYDLDLRLYCLGITKSRAPRHPLYIKANTKPEIF